MTTTQLSPSISVDVEGFGKGEALFLLDYGPDKDLYWIVFLDDSGKSIVASNNSIKKSIDN